MNKMDEGIVQTKGKHFLLNWFIILESNSVRIPWSPPTKPPLFPDPYPPSCATNPPPLPPFPCIMPSYSLLFKQHILPFHPYILCSIFQPPPFISVFANLGFPLKSISWGNLSVCKWLINWLFKNYFMKNYTFLTKYKE